MSGDDPDAVRPDDVAALIAAATRAGDQVELRIGGDGGRTVRVDAAVAPTAADANDDEAHAKTRFLTRVTHELRAPLAGVIGMIDLAVGDVSAEARGSHLASARASARHLLELIDDLLDASREDTWRINVVDIEFDLAEVLSQAVAMVVPRAHRKHLRLVGRVEPGVDTARVGDPLRLRQILVNLLYNAVKFTHHGQVETRIAGGSDDTVAITIEDTGIGIAPDQQAAVFEPYVQASRHPKEGVGLGLAITRELVSALGGTIELASTVGVGTRFTVRVPLRRSTGTRRTSDRLRAMTQPSAPGVPVPARPMRVLIADDNATNAAIAQVILERAGHSTVVVEDGAAAVTAAAGERFDAILMDLEMRRLDGASATRAIRAAEHAAGRARVPVIALTAHRDAALTAAAAGMDSYLAKPLDVDELSALLARAGRGDLAGPIDHAARLSRVSGRIELGRTVVASFLSHRPTLIRPIDEAISLGSATDLHRAAHGLRGALAMVGAVRAAELAAAIEQASLPDATRLRDELAAEIARASAELELVAPPAAARDAPAP